MKQREGKLVLFSNLKEKYDLRTLGHVHGPKEKIIFKCESNKSNNKKPLKYLQR